MTTNDRPGRGEPLLAVRDLVVETDQGVRLVDQVSLTVPTGATVGLVGESGSGKSLTSLAVLGLLPPGVRASSGQVELAGVDLLAAPANVRRAARGKQVAMIFQDPLAALNPRLSVGRQIDEILRVRDGLSGTAAAQAAVELLRRVDMPEPEQRARSFPHQLSGGQRQRAMIALALAGGPALLLCDEPTTALDVTVQKRILDLLARLQTQENLAMLLVSHDLRVISHTAPDLVVMYAGRVVESGPTAALLAAPHHPYTAALVRNIPSPRSRAALPQPLTGVPPDPAHRPPGCAFAPRCPMAQAICSTESPALRPVGSGRLAACHFAEEVTRD
jgi:peptide/nickel transport system ATP-binding protein/oligopeptide transport system ATP-binding protein